MVTNKNVDKLIYVKDSKIYVRTLATRTSPFIYTYMADRHILLQVSSPSQVCNLTLKTMLIICVFVFSINFLIAVLNNLFKLNRFIELIYSKNVVKFIPKY